MDKPGCVDNSELIIYAKYEHILCHLQRLVDVGGQDGQKVINATDQESTCKTERL